MISNDLLKYMSHGLEWLVYGGIAYLAALASTQYYTIITSKRIDSKKELELIVDDEARKLGLDPEKIDVVHDAERSSSKKIGDKYMIYIGNKGKNRPTIRHEICHIKKDCDKIETYNALKLSFYYLFIAEPRAALYELGIDSVAKDRAQKG